MVADAAVQSTVPLELFFGIAGGVILLLIGVIGWFLRTDREDSKQIREKMTECLNRLVARDEVKDEQISSLKESVERLEDAVFPVNYRK